MLVKVFSRSASSEGVDFTNRDRIDGSESAFGVARTCWTFFAPANWVRMDGHLTAFDRSIWSRAVQAASSG